jgi:smad nuclear-interacting protein 1
MTTNNKRHRSGEESEANTGWPSRSRKTSLSSPSDGPKQHRDREQEDEHVVHGKPKEKPNYEASGRLKADLSVTQNGVVLKHAEPDDAADPPERPKYRMYVFDGDNIVDTIRLSERSWYMYGRDSRVCTVLVDDKSVSKQHAVIQFRRKVYVDKYGDTTEQIK